MSKKTNTAKQKARTSKPRKDRKHIKGKHANPYPLFGLPSPGEIPPLSDVGSLMSAVGPMMVTMLARQIGYLESYYVLTMWKTIRARLMAESPDPSAKCAACGMSASQAHEKSMGMLCPKTETLIHKFEKTEPVQ